MPRFLALVLLGSFACGPKTLQARMKNAEHLSDEAYSLLNEAETALQAMEPDRAGKSLEGAKTLLADRDMEQSPEGELLRSRYDELANQLPGVRKARKQRDAEEAIRTRRAQVGLDLQTLREGAPTLKRADVADKEVKALEKAADNVDDNLKNTAELEAIDSSFAGWVKRARADVEASKKDLTRARKRLGFADEVGARHQDCVTGLLKAGQAKKGSSDRKDAFTSASQTCATCVEKTKPFLAGDLEAIKLPLATLTPKAVFSACQKAAQDAKKEAAKPLAKAAAPAKKTKKK